VSSGAIKVDSIAGVSTSTFLELLSGNEKGQRIEVRGARLSLGRAEDNDIVVTAEGVSRRHAFMAMSDGDWFIRDNDSKNGVLINGEKMKESWLASGDIVALGDFVFRFHHPKLGETPYGDAANLPASAGLGGLPSAGSVGTGDLAGVAPAPSPAASKSGNNRVMIYGGAIALLAVLFLMLPGEDTPTSDTPASAKDRLARDFDVSKAPADKFGDGKKLPMGIEDPLLKKAEQDMATLDWSDSSLQQSELFFRRGQRDYLSKNYHRAIEAFQTSLSMYQGHSLAERYLRHAIAEAESEAKKSLATGVQYFEALQYQRAIYHFREAQQLMAHRPQEPMMKEAQRYIQQSELRLRAAELFP
jgi:pSer/pThr/pTyr-binding forkhead associated (FHA) protein